VLVAVTVAARLPQLLSSNLLLDGDECIVGLMGLHVLGGRTLPLFMYGQKYGLAIVEAPAAALSFALFGAGAVPLKLAMLAIWTTGIAFQFLAFSRAIGARRSFWLTLLVALMPMWAAFSMKALSGYVTAFTAAACVTYIVTANANRRTVPWIAAGLITGVIYFAQPLWLPPLVPVVLFSLVSSRKPVHWIAYGGAAAVVFAVVSAVKVFILSGGVDAWSPPAAGNPHLLASLRPLVDQVHVSLTGSFSLAHALPHGRVTGAVAWSWLVVLAAVTLVQLYRLAGRRYLAWSHVLFASIVLTVAANWILLDARDARYMLPLGVPLVFLAGVELFDLADGRYIGMRACVAILVLVAAAHALATREFAHYTFMWWTNAAGAPSETRTLHNVLGYLQARGVRRVYSTNALLQWNIAFYSDESVIARWKAARDRYPPYSAAVDAALDVGEPVAIVGYAAYTYGLERLVRDPQGIAVIDGKYFVYLGADRALLERAGFRFTR
jgi:hypothetical protein